MKNKLTKILGVKASELNFSLYMFLNFFLIITTFWILKPLKKISFISLYDQNAFTILNMSFSASEAELLAKRLICLWRSLLLLYSHDYQKNIVELG